MYQVCANDIVYRYFIILNNESNMEPLKMKFKLMHHFINDSSNMF